MKMLRAWAQASRLPSQSYIFFPLLLGMLAARAAGAAWSWTVFAAVALFGQLLQLYIVYANDYADVESDRLNRTFTPFSGGSRVIVEGLLTRRAMGVAAVAAAALTLAAAGAAAWAWDRPLLWGLGAAGLVLLWMYSYPPLRLSYTGGGELLQALGTAYVLPLFGFYALTGDCAFPWVLSFMLTGSHLACAVATALPDRDSDALSGKHTLAVRLGAAAPWLSAGLQVLTLAWTGARTLPASAGMTLFFAVPAAAAGIALWMASGARPRTPTMLAFTTASVGCTVTATAYLCAWAFTLKP